MKSITPTPHPPDRPYLWTRGLQVGGRSLTWGGITLRLSDEDFAGVEGDDGCIRWPLRSNDLAEDYSALERMLKVHGDRDGLAHLPMVQRSRRFPSRAPNNALRRPCMISWPSM